jgi:hypothetical protein
MHRATVGNAALCVMTAMAVGDARPGPATSAQPGGQSSGAPTPAPPDPRAADTESIEAIIGAFYSAAAGQKGQPRNWEAFRALFLPEARFILARAAGQGKPDAFLSAPDYVENVAKYFEKGGYFDAERSRRMERFGNIAHVWSTFETRRIGTADGPALMLGINSIQLLYRQDRWWIVTIFWELERPDNPIPAEYLVGKP